MTTGATGQLGLALPVQGELSGTWGDTVNNGITQYTNIAIAATLTLTNDGAVTLANTTGDASASNITSSLTGAGTVTAQFAIVRITGTLTTTKVVTAPSYSKTYVVVNAATGGTVTFKASGQTGVSIAVGESAWVYYNGTDYVKIVGTATAGAAGGSNTQVQYNSSGSLAGSSNLTFDGTSLTLGGGTANGVTYLNGSKVLTSGSALTFDGTNFGVGGAAGNSTNYSTITARGTNGGIYEFNAGATLQSYILGNTSELRLQTQSTQAITFVYNGSEAMRLNGTGLGIGTSSPSQKLEIAGTTSSTVAKIVSTTGANYNWYTNTGGSFYVGKENSAGSAFGAPAYSSVLYSDGAYPLVFFTNATSRMTLDSAGNLGLGVTPSAWYSPAKVFQIGNGLSLWSSANTNANLSQNLYLDATATYRWITANPATNFNQSNGAFTWQLAAGTPTAGGAIGSFNTYMTLDASGNLGVGTTSIAAVTGFSSSRVVEQIGGSGGYGQLRLGNDAGTMLDHDNFGTTTTTLRNLYGATSTSALMQIQSGYITFGTGTSYTERARISAAGGFSVGTTADPGAGAIYATGNITAYYSSDIKFKENVRDIPDALATVNAIGGKLFDWTDEYIESKGGADGYFVQKADFGVVAQDVQKVFPIAVRTRPDGSLAVDYEKLGALAFAALTELTKRVEALESK